MRAPIFQQVLDSIADAGRDLVNLRRGPNALKTIIALCGDLLSQKGEASGTALAREVVSGYKALNGKSVLQFFNYMASDLGVDTEIVDMKIQHYLQDSNEENRMQLAIALEPRRRELIRRMNMAPGGTAALVEMRKRLLTLTREHPHLKVVDEDFKHLLEAWFNRGFLVLELVDWNTPAAVLEKLIAYESVHEIQGWDDLRRRLDYDRRCFAFFHPALPGEPLIFVEVALVNGISSAIQPLLKKNGETSEPAKCDTAVFYSINNCQDGLRGISFGNFLIKQVVVELLAELPKLKTFVTLSPIPGMGRWLESTLQSSAEKGDKEAARLQHALATEGWCLDDELRASIQKPLLKLGANYLLHAKKGDKPLDPVSRFHLGNGARLERINWLGDTSLKGIEQSAGMLVNYLYDLSDIEKNHEAYTNENKVVAARAVSALAKG